MNDFCQYGYVNKNNNKVTPYKKLICDKGYSTKVLFFPEGINGEKEFGIVFDGMSNPTIRLSSCEKNCVIFCIDPNYVLPDYSPFICQEDKLAINLDNTKNLVVLTPIVFKATEGSKTKELFVNPKELILINVANFFAKRISSKNLNDLIALKNIGRFSIVQ